MRQLAYLFLAYLLLGLQLGIGSYASYRGVSPNLLLLLVVFISLNARRDEAMLVCFFIGAVQDLLTLQPLGLFAFSYGIVAMLVSWLAESVKRSHPLTHVSLAFMSIMVVGMILLIHDLIRPITAGSRVGPRVVVVQAVYTTLLSPLVILLLQQSTKVILFDPGSRRRGRV